MPFCTNSIRYSKFYFQSAINKPLKNNYHKTSGVLSTPCQLYMMKLFAEIVNSSQLLTIFAKNFIIDHRCFTDT